jgi:hypothetical protein
MEEMTCAEGAAIMKEIMEAYGKYRDLWMLHHGTAEGFNDWFRLKTTGKEAPCQN